MTREPDPTGFDAIVASWQRLRATSRSGPHDLSLDDDRADVDPDARSGSPAGAGTEADADDRTDHA